MNKVRNCQWNTCVVDYQALFEVLFNAYEDSLAGSIDQAETQSCSSELQGEPMNTKQSIVRPATGARVLSSPPRWMNL